MILLLLSLSHLSQTEEGEVIGSGNLLGFIIESPSIEGEFVINPSLPPGDSTSFTTLFFFGLSSCAKGTRIPSIAIEIPLPFRFFTGFYMLQERDFTYFYTLEESAFERDTLIQFSRGRGERTSFAGFSGWGMDFFSLGLALRYVKLSREKDIYIEMLSPLGRDYADTTKEYESWMEVMGGVSLRTPWISLGGVINFKESVWNTGISLRYKDLSLILHLTQDGGGIGGRFGWIIVGFERRKGIDEAGVGILFPLKDHKIFTGYKIIHADEEYIHRFFVGMMFKERW